MILDKTQTKPPNAPETAPGLSHERDDIPGGRYWTVAHTHPQAERWAARNIADRGYEVYFPVAFVRRRDRALPSLFHHVEMPLFPRYVFVWLDGPWTPVRYCPGVHDLLMDDGRPGRVPVAVIKVLQAVPVIPAVVTAWAPGTPCSLVSGPMRGHDAVVLSVARKVATLAVMMLGAIRTITVSLDLLEARQ